MKGAGPARQQRVQQMLSRRMGSVVVVAEAIHRRHNTSAILRTCEAFGVHTVHLITGEFRVSRGAARGAERWLNIRHWTSLQACVAALKSEGFVLYAADVGRDAVSPATVPVDQPIAVLFGNELRGVSEAARALCDGFITVPMYGMMESLNVSVAAACVIQHVAERRRAHVGGGDLSAAQQQEFFSDWLERCRQSTSGVRARVT